MTRHSIFLKTKRVWIVTRLTMLNGLRGGKWKFEGI